jgi:hypothetical protein
MRLLHTDAFPGASGEIMLSAYQGENVIELVFELDNSISLYHEKGDHTVLSLPHETSEIVEITIRRIVGEIWNMSGSYTTGISTRKRIDSIDWRSGISKEAGLSFKLIALETPSVSYVNTSINSMSALPENQLYSGFSLKTNYQQVAR